jgi:RimJ/RimL family protein N-acetyltransferase
MSPRISTVYSLLEQDILRNLVTLKMLNSHASAMSFELRRDGDAWGLLSLLPVQESNWDRKVYPDCRYVAFIDGNSAVTKKQLLAHLPETDLIVKTSDVTIRELLDRDERATKINSFRSFTTGQTPIDYESNLPQMAEYDKDAWAMFQSNGYEDEELTRYFDNGARWFGIRSSGQLVSVCFVFQNHRNIWEVAGVYTATDHRRHGRAKQTVLCALGYLQKSHLTPRYQAKWDNLASIALAKSCGLVGFLQVDHYLLRTG